MIEMPWRKREGQSAVASPGVIECYVGAEASPDMMSAMLVQKRFWV